MTWCYKSRSKGSWVVEMAQRVKALTAKFDHLRTIPGSHWVEVENRLPQVVLSPPQLQNTCTYAYTHTPGSQVLIYILTHRDTYSTGIHTP